MTELSDYRRLVERPNEAMHQATVEHLRQIIDGLARQIYWQTIDTAPSDGREVLVCGGSHMAGTELREADGEWWRKARADGMCSVPTHWMEKPTPITGVAGTGKET